MKKAFTLIELVFVLVVIGIIAATIIPRTNTNPLQEAAVQILSHIRYTQHLALVDDKFDQADSSWYKKRWLIVFDNNVSVSKDTAYTIFSDNNGANNGDPDVGVGEIAINPQALDKELTGGYGLSILPSNTAVTKKLNLTKSYGVTDVSFSGAGCVNDTARRLNFDHQGRPMIGNLSGLTEAYSNSTLLQADCNITISDGTNNAIITISPETGYARIIKYK